MTLIKSISGIRGTIGGKVGEGLSPLDTVRFASAYGSWIKQECKKESPFIIVGRDARISGDIIRQLVISTLQSLGINVLDLGLSTTPTVEVAVQMENADGGIILTASHNPKQWNALKLLNDKGEFINAKAGLEVLAIAEKDDFDFCDVDSLGTYKKDDTYIQKHIDSVLDLELVNVQSIKNAKFKVVVDAVNSTGGIAVPALLESLGVECVPLYCEPNGHFPHNPEPLPEHLTEISKLVVEHNADCGIVVDPDVDRLAIVNEDGSMFGEEYTLVAVADYILSKTKGNTVSNLSSSRALREVTQKHGGTYFSSAVGEVNVVEQMKSCDAIIGGEGNGGIIYPSSHYGRDSIVGIALFLSLLAERKMNCSDLRSTYPNFFMSKNKIELTPEIDVDMILSKMTENYSQEEVTTIDGVKIDFENEWVHLRKSNTEPIIRIYTESISRDSADSLAIRFINEIQELTQRV
ncbi:phosphoglucosamine mutase [bacterium]|nr:phosphoglucosamine mutase [bacterium]MDB2675065.1 phosphoglucosamine mutase [Flavobacteriales bacterium]